MADALTGRLATLARIQRTGLVPVIRADYPRAEAGDRLVELCQALCDGGIDVAEITMTTPGALDAIDKATQKLGDACLIGAGSVLDAQTARNAVLAGAQFVFSPTLNLEVIQTAHRYDKLAVPGALTPTEILNAWQGGADMVKVFPANHFGPKYFKDLLGPLPQLRLTPTGGVSLDTVKDWIDAGAACLGVGSALVKKDLIAKRDWAELSKLARQFVDAVAAARQGGG